MSSIAQGGIWQQDTSHRVNIEPPPDRQRPRSDEFPRGRPYDGNAQHPAPAAGQYLDMAVGGPFDAGTIVFVEGPAEHPYRDTPRGRLGLGQTDMGELRVGEDDAWNGLGPKPQGTAQDDAAQHQAGLVARDMDERRCPGHVADGVDVPVAGAQRRIDDDAGGADIDARFVEREPLHIAAPATGDQEVAALDAGVAKVIAKRQAYAVLRLGDLLDSDTGA